MCSVKLLPLLGRQLCKHFLFCIFVLSFHSEETKNCNLKNGYFFVCSLFEQINWLLSTLFSHAALITCHEQYATYAKQFVQQQLGGCWLPAFTVYPLTKCYHWMLFLQQNIPLKFLPCKPTGSTSCMCL